MIVVREKIGGGTQIFLNRLMVLKQVKEVNIASYYQNLRKKIAYNQINIGNYPNNFYRKKVLFINKKMF